MERPLSSIVIPRPGGAEPAARSSQVAISAERSGQQVKRNRLGTQVADIVREMILVGDLGPGEVVMHEEMAERLGVSTMPVREALVQLSHEGFIANAPGRSFRVVPITQQDIRDIHWVHAILVSEMARRACVNAH